MKKWIGLFTFLIISLFSYDAFCTIMKNDQITQECVWIDDDVGITTNLSMCEVYIIDLPGSGTTLSVLLPLEIIRGCQAETSLVNFLLYNNIDAASESRFNRGCSRDLTDFEYVSKNYQITNT